MNIYTKLGVRNVTNLGMSPNEELGTPQNQEHHKTRNQEQDKTRIYEHHEMQPILRHWGVPPSLGLGGVVWLQEL